MFEVNNKDTRRHWRRFGVFIDNFEYISHLFLMFLLLTLNKWMLAGYQCLKSGLRKYKFSCKDLFCKCKISFENFLKRSLPKKNFFSVFYWKDNLPEKNRKFNGFLLIFSYLSLVYLFLTLFKFEYETKC